MRSGFFRHVSCVECNHSECFELRISEKTIPSASHAEASYEKIHTNHHRTADLVGNLTV